jgi:hypothetical protein
MIIWFIAALVIIVTIYAFSIFFTPKITKSSDPGPWILDSNQASNNWVTNDATYVSNFLKNQSSSFRIFYYIQSLPRTGAIYDTTTNTANFNSTTDSFDICDTSTSTCTHPGFAKLLQFDTSLWIELLQAPDASRPGLPKTQLCIQTTNQTGKSYIETFPLPPFPQQKWVMLTLSHEGSKYDVYYNGQLAASIKTTNVPKPTATKLALSNGTFTGRASYLLSKTSAMTASEVASDYSTNTNTLGEPYDSLFPSLNLNLCPSGNCFSGPSVRPSNPLVVWKSEY